MSRRTRWILVSLVVVAGVLAAAVGRALLAKRATPPASSVAAL